MDVENSREILQRAEDAAARYISEFADQDIDIWQAAFEAKSYQLGRLTAEVERLVEKLNKERT